MVVVVVVVVVLFQPQLPDHSDNSRLGERIWFGFRCVACACVSDSCMSRLVMLLLLLLLLLLGWWW